MRTTPMLFLLACGGPEPFPGNTDENDGKPDADADTDADADSDADGDTDTDSPGTWTAHLLDATLNHPRGLTVGDFTGDGKLDVLVTAGGDIELGALDGGQVALYELGANLDSWTRIDVVTPDQLIEFPNQPLPMDLDADGDLDFVLTAGLFICSSLPLGDCGSLSWVEQTAGGWALHTFVDGDDRFYQGGVLADIDHDGTVDLVVSGERVGPYGTDAQTHWYRGVGSASRFEATERLIGTGGGSFPTVRDIDGDGDDDIAVAEFAVPGESAVWYQRTGEPSGGTPNGTWSRFVIDSTLGTGWQMGWADIDGDGLDDALMTNHVNAADGDLYVEGAYRLVPAADVRQAWTPTLLSTGIAADPSLVGSTNAAPGAFGTGDLDGDGDIDLAIAGDGDPGVFVLINQNTSFDTMEVHPFLPEAFGMIVADLDGNGTQEVVLAGAVDNLVLVLERN